MGSKTSVADLVFDDLAKGVERLRPRQEPPVDEECGRRVHPDGISLPNVVLDRLTELPRAETLAEGSSVEAEIGGELTVGLG